MLNKQNILIIGAGLIGGSIGIALKQYGYCNKLGFIDINFENLKLVKANSSVDWISDNINKLSEFNPDVIVVSVPTLAAESVINNLINIVSEKCIITDVCSTKYNLSKIESSNYVPGHPIAGREQSGFQAIDPGMFNRAKVILTPNEKTSQSAIALITELWSILNANVLLMNAKEHDEIFAYSSHLPHLVAYGLMATILNKSNSQDIYKYCAGGLKDYTRVAGSDPNMWHDICISNQNGILEALTSFESSISSLKKAIQNKDSDCIRNFFTCAKQAKISLEKYN